MKVKLKKLKRQVFQFLIVALTTKAIIWEIFSLEIILLRHFIVKVLVKQIKSQEKNKIQQYFST